MRHMKILNLPCTIWDKGYLVDGGRRIWVSTNELAPEQLALLNQYGDNKTFGYFFFKPETGITQDEIDKLEVPEVKPEFKGEKTPSQRLRNVIYVFWEKQGAKGDFETFYKRQMERLINKIKEQLD